MIRIEPAPAVPQLLYCPREKRRRPHYVQKFVRTRYTIDAAQPRLLPPKRQGIWGALAALFRGAA